MTLRSATSKIDWFWKRKGELGESFHLIYLLGAWVGGNERTSAFPETLNTCTLNYPWLGCKFTDTHGRGRCSAIEVTPN